LAPCLANSALLHNVLRLMFVGIDRLRGASEARKPA
jgi:hypothetical protein